MVGVCAVAYAAQYSLTLDDWKNHHDVKEVRNIYNEIKTGIKNNSYTNKKREFDVKAISCATYPVKSEAISVDTNNRIRLYKIEQIGSHREPFTIERYYDSKGTLRFVFVDYIFANVRIYINSVGKVFWAVEQKNNKFTVFDSANGDWEVRPFIAEKAGEEFEAKQLCPEILK